jgi:hypothetical protein
MLRGAKPKIVPFRQPRSNRYKDDDPNNPTPKTEGRPQSPVKLEARSLWYWNSYIKECKWLGAEDSQRAYMWCILCARFEELPKASKTTVSAMKMVSQIRALGSELGLDPSSRARMGVKTVYRGGKSKLDRSEKYFA